jgi:hypothetical protein
MMFLKLRSYLLVKETKLLKRQGAICGILEEMHLVFF